MDAVKSRSGDAAKKDRRTNKVVNVDVDPVSGTIYLLRLADLAGCM
jgi:hypothetical protein